jgi:hypothetical protein
MKITAEWLKEYGFDDSTGHYLSPVKNDYKAKCFIEVFQVDKEFVGCYYVNGPWASENLHTHEQIIKLHTALQGK